jgi:hypothetical protein
MVPIGTILYHGLNHPVSHFNPNSLVPYKSRDTVLNPGKIVYFSCDPIITGPTGYGTVMTYIYTVTRDLMLIGQPYDYKYIDDPKEYEILANSLKNLH